jgi:hypothetical protein
MENWELIFSMADKITFEVEADGIAIHIGDVAAAIAIFELIVAAKFQPGLRWKYLLSPIANEMLSKLRDFIKKDSRFTNFDNQQVEFDITEVGKELNRYVISRSDTKDLDFRELLKIATHPYKLPESTGGSFV